jgi:hypothetical protein
VTNRGTLVDSRWCGSAAGRVKPLVSLRGPNERRSRERFTIAEQGILLAAQPSEFGASNPGTLNELKLPGNIRVEAEKMQAGLRIGGGEVYCRALVKLDANSRLPRRIR